MLRAMSWFEPSATTRRRPGAAFAIASWLARHARSMSFLPTTLRPRWRSPWASRARHHLRPDHASARRTCSPTEPGRCPWSSRDARYGEPSNTRTHRWPGRSGGSSDRPGRAHVRFVRVQVPVQDRQEATVGGSDEDPGRRRPQLLEYVVELVDLLTRGQVTRSRSALPEARPIVRDHRSPGAGRELAPRVPTTAPPAMRRLPTP
jgi:hypothetical protein